MKSIPQKVFHVMRKAEPKPDHPEFNDWDYCWVVAFVYADSARTAEDKFNRIFEHLPYEFSGTVKVYDPPKALPEYEQTFERKTKEAAAIGIAFFLASCSYLAMPDRIAFLLDEGW